ncbi:hypothetical protein Goarm_020163, partial [Gossypium armourianum]|nr:hypothetical protein [Gossypium armourianum]
LSQVTPRARLRQRSRVRGVTFVDIRAGLASSQNIQYE